MVCRGNAIPSLPRAWLWSGVADVTLASPPHQAQAQHFSLLDHPPSTGAAGTDEAHGWHLTDFGAVPQKGGSCELSVPHLPQHLSYWSGTEPHKAQDGKSIHGLVFKSVTPQLLSDCSAYLATVSSSKLANTFCNVTPHNTKFIKHLSCSGLNASSIPI